MLLYHPLDGDIYAKKIEYKPRTCFVMTKIGRPIPREIKNIRITLKKYLKIGGIKEIDADSSITGRDFLVKIWESIISVPLGIAIISSELSTETLENIFYEIGLFQALGKETLIIKTENSTIPSDFKRTEYIEYGSDFKTRINKYIKTFFQQADHYHTVADQLGSDPLIAIDYLKRAYLIDKKRHHKKEAREIFNKSRKLFNPHYVSTIEHFLNS